MIKIPGVVNAYASIYEVARFEVVSATTLAYIAIAGAVASAAGTVATSMQASSAANYNSQVASQNAQAAQQQAQLNAQAQQRKAAQTIGAARAAYGASGVSASGSALDVLSSSASLAELDRQNILYKGQVQSAGYADEAALDSAKAGNAIGDGLMTASGQLASGAATAAGRLNAAGTSPITPGVGTDSTNAIY